MNSYTRSIRSLCSLVLPLQSSIPTIHLHHAEHSLGGVVDDQQAMDAHYLQATRCGHLDPRVAPVDPQQQVDAAGHTHKAVHSLVQRINWNLWWQFIWAVIMIVAWLKTGDMLNRLFPGLNPLSIYRWPIDFGLQLVRLARRLCSEVASLSWRFVKGIKDSYALLLKEARSCL